MNKTIIKTPSTAEVDKYIKRWDTLENYVLQENALDKLFFEVCASNDDINNILIKCSALNDFYSTNIFSIFTVAKHILALNIDKRLKTGDLSLVGDIANVSINGKPKYFYSFASKYCSHHNPKMFAIYDSYVEKCLVYFNKRDRFSDFKKRDLKNYSVFTKVLLDFKAFYRLDNYNLKEIDKYLWQLGKEFFPNNYGRRRESNDNK
jgi:hypothetical protein